MSDVDSSLVIGATYNRYDVEPATLDKLYRINEQTKNSRIPTDCACYTKVGSLPLYAAIEGKNRVRAFQLYGQPISAVIVSAHFPSAHTLELHEVVGSGIFAISGEMFDKPKVLILPSVTVRLLESYGVRWGRRLSRGMTGRRARKFERERREVRIKLASGWAHETVTL